VQESEKDIVIEAVEKLGKIVDRLRGKGDESIAHQANIVFYLMSRISKDIPEAIGILDFVKHFLNHLPYDEKTFEELAEKARSLLLTEA